ncbi:hypothetical protein TWF281_010463 [Arthrobotrys megalospora]
MQKKPGQSTSKDECGPSTPCQIVEKWGPSPYEFITNRRSQSMDPPQMHNTRGLKEV